MVIEGTGTKKKRNKKKKINEERRTKEKKGRKKVGMNKENNKRSLELRNHRRTVCVKEEIGKE